MNRRRGGGGGGGGAWERRRGREGVDGGERASVYVIPALEHRDNIVVNIGG